MKNRNKRWLVAWLLILPSLTKAADLGKEVESPEQEEEKDASAHSKEARGIFSPRMDYEQWTPLGMGDPLKNDPTYDYVPPVLDRVRYWIDPESRKPDHSIPEEPKKTEVLLLGVTSKRPSTGTSTMAELKEIPGQPSYLQNNMPIADSRKDTFDPFLKMVEGPKFNVPNSFQKISKPHYSLPSYYQPNQFNQNKFKTEQRMPYTMLVPPPIQTSEIPDNLAPYQKENNLPSATIQPLHKNTFPPSQKPTGSTNSHVTVEHANIIYQSSTYGNEDEFKLVKSQNHFGSFPDSSNQVIFKAPSPNSTVNVSIREMAGTRNNISSIIEFLTVNPSVLTPISDFPEKSRNTSGKILTQGSFGSSTEDSSQYPEVMIKGEVTDADLGLANTYVNIGKAEAQMHPPSGIAGISVDPPKMSVMQPPVVMNINPLSNSMDVATQHLKSSLRSPEIVGNGRPVTLQILHTMQTMQPPPPPPSISKPKIHATLHGLLQKEKVNAQGATVTEAVTKRTSGASHFLPTTAHTEQTTSTTPSTATTEETVSLTTDPLFKHYKQPTEPLKGPLYLIIQGHSKVKTYGPSKQVHGISVQETNEISIADEKENYPVKHLHSLNKEMSDKQLREGRANDLQSLSHVVQTGLGAIDFPEASLNRRKDDNIQETELVIRYDVSSQGAATSERYHKGIVEAGDVSRKFKSGQL